RLVVFVFGIFSFFRVLIFGGRSRRSKKLALLKRMRRFQRIMIQQKLHEQNAPERRDDARDRELKRSKGKSSSNNYKSHLKQPPKKTFSQKENISRTRNKRSDALKRSKTIKERVIKSRERNLNLWEQGI
ncbi:MAG: hypothetical protein MK137_10320, partial [Rickettsiales bacterium]|nr:hypothetical protein [Rickettsiales bacterium]